MFTCTHSFVALEMLCVHFIDHVHVFLPLPFTCCSVYLCVLLLLVLQQVCVRHRLLTHIAQADVPPAVDLMSREIRLWDFMLTGKNQEHFNLVKQMTKGGGGERR